MTVEAFDWHPEPYAETGNQSSDGAKNQLGRPGMPLYEILVREAAQNAWDAKAAGDHSVDFHVELGRFTESQVDLLLRLFGAQAPPNLPIKDALLAHDADFLMLSDRGTTGLGGPSRAGRVYSASEATDFVDFLRNIGTPPDKAHGGGTYGYGKAILYRTSKVSTMLVYTRATFLGRRVHRFIGVALGSRFEQPCDTGELRQYTGRHWWGRRSEGGIVDPIEGDEADSLAHALGMDKEFGEGCGTTLLLLSPRRPRLGPDETDDADEQELDDTEAAEEMAHHLLWNFWPKMVRDDESHHPPMRFRVSSTAGEVVLPHLEDESPFELMVEALRDARAALRGEVRDGSHVIDIKRYSSRIGVLALRKLPRETRTPVCHRLATATPVPSPAGSVALMRLAELVVNYEHASPMWSEKIEYAGVFLTEAEHDRTFAASEPPTHDKWEANALDDLKQRQVVRLALRKIGEEMEAFARPIDVHPSSEAEAPTAHLSERLGSLISGIGGTGAERQATGPSGNKGTSHQAQIHILDRELSLHEDGRPLLTVRFTVRPAPRSTRTVVKARWGALLDGGGREKDPPIGEACPELVGWGEGVTALDGASASFEGQSPGEASVLIAMPVDAGVAVHIDATAEGAD